MAQNLRGIWQTAFNNPINYAQTPTRSAPQSNVIYNNPMFEKPFGNGFDNNGGMVFSSQFPTSMNNAEFIPQANNSQFRSSIGNTIGQQPPQWNPFAKLIQPMPVPNQAQYPFQPLPMPNQVQNFVNPNSVPMYVQKAEKSDGYHSADWKQKGPLTGFRATHTSEQPLNNVAFGYGGNNLIGSNNGYVDDLIGSRITSLIGNNRPKKGIAI